MRIGATALVLLSLAVPAAATLLTADRADAGKKKAPQRTWRYPVKGEHSYGNLKNTGFGVARPDGSRHRGQDIIANCGRPLIAAHRARVQERGYTSGVGYYVVLDGIGTRFSFVYDHMKGPGGPRKGKVVKPGRRIGYVGDTGVSTGICHLHFEIWKGRWGRGKLVNPLKRLRWWDKFSKGAPVKEKELSRASKAVAATE